MSRKRSNCCLECGKVKTKENTYWSNRNNALRSRCKECYANYHKQKSLEDPSLRDTKHLYYTFGLTLDDYNRLLESQGGGCAICGDSELLNSRLSVDHDHSCCPGRKSCGKCIRGLLCRRCNTGIGNLGESEETLTAAISYIASFEIKVECENESGYIARLTKKWLEEYGPPICPHCNEPMAAEKKEEE